MDAYNRNSVFNNAQGATATFTPTIQEQGKYEVYVHHSTILSGGRKLPRDPNASYTVNHALGNSQTFVNQNYTVNGWFYLGAFSFNKGTSGFVTLERTTGDTSN